MHLTLLAILLSLMFPVYTPQRRIQTDQNTVSGALTVDEKATPLNYGYVIDYGDGIFIFLTDKPITADEADDTNTLNVIKKKSLRGFRLQIKKRTQKLLEAAGFHETITSAAWIINDLDTLEFENFDEKMVAGRFMSRKTEVWNKKSYTYNVKFKLRVNAPFDPAAVKVIGNGINTEPGKVFAAYHKVIMTGNYEELKQYISESLPEAYRSSESLESAQGFKKMESPVELTMSKVNIHGDSAEITVEGSRRGSKAVGTIKMKLEKGKWKIAGESWKSG